MQITALVLAAMFGASFISAWRMSRINSDLRLKIKESGRLVDKFKRISDHINDSCQSLIEANTSENVSYFPIRKNTEVTVFRRSFSNSGREFHTFIKSFRDDDNEFNLRQAEELCEILNS